MAIGKAEIGGGIASGVADAIRLFGPGMIDRRQAEQQLQQQAAERDQAITAFQAMQEGMNTGNADAVQQQATFLMSLPNPLYNKWGLAGYDWVREANKPQVQLPTQTRTTTSFAPRPGSGFMGVSPQGATTATPGAQRFGETESFTSGRAQLSNFPFMPPTISSGPPSPKFALPSFNAGKPAGASQQVRVPSYNPQPMTQTTEETKPFGDWTDDEIWKLAQNDPAVFIRYKEAQQRQVNAAAQQEQNEWRRQMEAANLAMKQQKLQMELNKMEQAGQLITPEQQEQAFRILNRYAPMLESPDITKKLEAMTRLSLEYQRLKLGNVDLVRLLPPEQAKITREQWIQREYLAWLREPYSDHRELPQEDHERFLRESGERFDAAFGGGVQQQEPSAANPIVTTGREYLGPPAPTGVSAAPAPRDSMHTQAAPQDTLRFTDEEIAHMRDIIALDENKLSTLLQARDAFSPREQRVIEEALKMRQTSNSGR